MKIGLEQLKNFSDVVSICGVPRKLFGDLTKETIEQYAAMQHGIAGDDYTGWIKVKTDKSLLLYNLDTLEIKSIEEENT